MSQEPVSERIKILLDKYAKGNKAEFGRAGGVSGQAIADLIAGKKGGPSFPVIQNMLRSFSDVRAEWLIFGEGEMLKSEANPVDPQKTLSYSGQPGYASSPGVKAHTPSIGDPNMVAAVLKGKNLKDEAERKRLADERGPGPTYIESKLRVLTVQVGPDNEENIEFVSQRAAAGYANGGFMEQDFIAQLPHFRLPDAAYRNGSFRCFQVSGESMQSTLYNGDWVICRYIEEPARDIRDNRVYVVVTDTDVRVKRVLNRLNDPNRANLALQSDNAAFPVDFVGVDQVREVWEAVGRLSRQFVNPRYDVSTELARHNAEIAELFALVRGLSGS